MQMNDIIELLPEAEQPARLQVYAWYIYPVVPSLLHFKTERGCAFFVKGLRGGWIGRLN